MFNILLAKEERRCIRILRKKTNRSVRILCSAVHEPSEQLLAVGGGNERRAILVGDHPARFNDVFQKIFQRQAGCKTRKIRPDITAGAIKPVTFNATGGMKEIFPLLKIPPGQRTFRRTDRFGERPVPPRPLRSGHGDRWLGQYLLPRQVRHRRPLGSGTVGERLGTNILQKTGKAQTARVFGDIQKPTEVAASLRRGPAPAEIAEEKGILDF